jgi:hypothetical protein
MEVAKGKLRDDYPMDFNHVVSYIAARIADIYADDIAKMNHFGISKHNRQVYEAKADGRGQGGRGTGARTGARVSFPGGRGRAQNGGRGFGERNASQHAQQTIFNGIDASDPL